MTNRILLVSFYFLMISCATVDEAYFHDFYNQRLENMNHLLVGERAPLKSSDLIHISHFDYNPKYRVDASFIKAIDPTPFEMATYSGKTKLFIEKGRLRFKLKDKSFELHVYQNVRYADHPIYGQYYFIPFKDASNDELTYGGGRYMDMNKKLFENKKVLLDFNQAYNPWCAYADGYNCPVPPVENHLDLAILAGEKAFNKEKE